ncbi:hypothetical protein ACIQKB_03995 [Streptomyces sp. NPDC092046]|uniref:hypothetical protein n=1 Tax=Streptomyces sp. NPDC092046 TaxID=3366009 RepID=UPI00382449E1
MTARAIQFDGSHRSVLAVMHFVDAGRGTTVIDIHASSDPAESHIKIPTEDGVVRINAGDWITRDDEGRLAARPAGAGS